MNKNNALSLFSLAIIFFASQVIVFAMTPYGAATSPDSLAHLDIASNIKNGKGAFATDFSATENSIRSLREQRAWPPLYPMLLSEVIDDKYDVTSVAMASKALAFTCLLFAFLIISSQTKWYIALISSLFLGISVPLLTVYCYTWNETLFLPLVLISIWSAYQYLTSNMRAQYRKTGFQALLTVVLIALAYTRYIGLVFAFLLPLVYFLGNRSSVDRVLFVAASTLYLLAISYLLYGNYLATGYISGMMRPVSDRSVLQNLLDIYHALLTVVPESFITIMVAAIVSLLVVFVARQAKPTEYSCPDNDKRILPLLLLIVCLLYIVSIVVLRSISAFDSLDVRLLSPLIMVAYIMLVVYPFYFDIRSKAGFLMNFVSALVVILVSVKGYQQFIASIKNWHEVDEPRLTMNYDSYYNNFTRNPARAVEKNLVSQLVGPNGVLVTDHPLIWEFMTQVQCVQRPELDLENLKPINALPDGSTLIVDKHEFDRFLRKYADRHLTYSYSVIDTLIAVRLPITVRSE